MSADADRYQTQLAMALRMRDVPGAKIGEILAQVQAHVAESGEDPIEAFGEPAEYARQFEVKRPSASSNVVQIALTFVGTGVITFACLRAAASGSTVASIAIAIFMAALLVIGRYFLFSGSGRGVQADQITDPRTGKRIGLPGERIGWVMISIWLLVFVGLMAFYYANHN